MEAEGSVGGVVVGGSCGGGLVGYCCCLLLQSCVVVLLGVDVETAFRGELCATACYRVKGVSGGGWD